MYRLSIRCIWKDYEDVMEKFKQWTKAWFALNQVFLKLDAFANLVINKEQ